MIEKISFKKTIDTSLATVLEIDNLELVNKINEIIDKVNELDIKLHTAKFFTADQEKAIKQLLKLSGDEK